MPRVLCATVLVAVLSAAGCGGSDYSGKVDVPKGYSTERADSVSFVRPAEFRGQGLETAKGLKLTRFGDPAAKGQGAFVSVSTLPGAGARFDTLVSDSRSVIESTNGKVKLHEVDVPGATRAYRSEIEAPKQAGTPSAVHSQQLQVLLRDGTYVSLTAGTTDDDDSVDVDAVLGSFRVKGA
jgi:hypothetical protein